MPERTVSYPRGLNAKTAAQLVAGLRAHSKATVRTLTVVRVLKPDQPQGRIVEAF